MQPVPKRKFIWQSLLPQVEAFLAEQEPLEEENEDEEEEEEEAAAPRRAGGGGGSGLSEAMQAFLGEKSLARPQARRQTFEVYVAYL